MSQLDESKPYAMEYGIGGPRCYIQDGQKFDIQKRHIVEAAPAAESAEPEPLSDLHWQALKKLVEEKGGKWTGKASAIAFLED